MNKKGIKAKFPFIMLLSIIIIFFVLFIFNYNFSTTLEDNSNEYQITQMTINAEIREDNSIKIHETIDVNFDVLSHGIYRTMPKYQKIAYLENGKEKHETYEIELTDIYCSTKYKAQVSSEGYVIQIGDPYSYADENMRYELSYIIHLGDDKITSFDQLYYNFVGDGWDTTISNVTINLTFEKPVEDRLVDFYIGTNNEDIVLQVPLTNSSLSFTYDGTLPAYHGITARTLFEEGFFVTEKQSFVVDYVLLGLTLAVLLTALIVFFTQNHKKRIIPVVEFTAPEGITPADAGYIIDRASDRGEVSALFVYWASKGYVNIKDTDGKTIIVKIKDADDKMKDYEKSIFQAMFPKDVTEFDLASENMTVAKAINSTKDLIKNDNEKFFSSKINAFKNFYLVIFALMSALVFYFTSRQVLFVEIGIFDCILIGLGLFLSAKMILYAQTRKLTMSKFSHFMTWLLGLTFIIGTYVVFAYFCFNSYSNPLYNTITLPILLFILVVLSLAFNDRIEGENKEIGRILGLRKFILLTEKDRIEKLAQENPEMFYDVLPFAYVFGISGVWIEKFKDIEIPVPKWYVGADDMLRIYISIRLLGSLNAYNLALNRMLGTTFGKIITIGRAIGGSFGGGGGRSGGGLGGGGGGRW